MRLNLRFFRSFALVLLLVSVGALTLLLGFASHAQQKRLAPDTCSRFRIVSVISGESYDEDLALKEINKVSSKEEATKFQDCLEDVVNRKAAFIEMASNTGRNRDVPDARAAQDHARDLMTKLFNTWNKDSGANVANAVNEGS